MDGNCTTYPILDKVDSPADIKNFTMDQLRQLCSEIRQYMIECCSVNPGHLGSSLGAVELMVGLHYVYDAPKDKLVFDVGHQAYAHKIITGRREAFRKNRMKDGISGFLNARRANTMHSGQATHLHLFLLPSALQRLPRFRAQETRPWL